jgi:hypothetical protein
MDGTLKFRRVSLHKSPCSDHLVNSSLVYIIMFEKMCTLSGVMTVTIPTSSTQGGEVMNNDITTELIRQFGVSNPKELPTLVMYCLPSNVDLGAVAWGDQLGWKTWVYRQVCGHFSCHA